MDGPTLDVVDGLYGNEDDEDGDDEVDGGPEPWGRVLPLSKEFVGLELMKDEYTFGRIDKCDYCFEIQNGGSKNEHFKTFSKTHFRIYREKRKSSDSEYIVFIQDKSFNGTFVNGEKIGKNKKRVLNSDDEISLSFKKNRAFIFNECGSLSNQLSYPEEFREKYIMSKFLGRGACGEVRMAFGKENSHKFAVKIITKKQFSVGPVLGRAALEEVKIMKSIQHPCIIQIEDVYDTPNTLYIVLELAEGGELFDRVVAGKFSESTSKLFFYQMLVAIQYLHDRGITHRDIKPENILLASDQEETLIKVTDFGLSKFVGENSLMKTLCGTPSYLAPEILVSAGTLGAGYNKAVDLWSIGVILYIMLGGYPPFSDEVKEYTLKDQITNGRYSFPTKFWEGVSEDAIDMIKRLLTLDPKERISVSEALEHPWLQDKEVIDRAKRIMDEASSAHPSMSHSPIPGQKRLAPLDSTELESTGEFCPPPKRPTIEHMSPTSRTISPNGITTNSDGTASAPSES